MNLKSWLTPSLYLAVGLAVGLVFGERRAWQRVTPVPGAASVLDDDGYVPLLATASGMLQIRMSDDPGALPVALHVFNGATWDRARAVPTGAEGRFAISVIDDNWRPWTVWVDTNGNPSYAVAQVRIGLPLPVGGCERVCEQPYDKDCIVGCLPGTPAPCTRCCDTYVETDCLPCCVEREGILSDAREACKANGWRADENARDAEGRQVLTWQGWCGWNAVRDAAGRVSR